MINIGRVKKPIDFFENIYVGRGSPLGNPFPVSISVPRDIACDKFSEYIDLEMKNEYSKVYREIQRINRLIVEGKDINLQCFCAPNRCHAESIKRILESL